MSDLNNAIYAGTAALALYDYILTIPQEVDMVWQSKKFTGRFKEHYWSIQACRHWFQIVSNVVGNILLNMIATALVFTTLRTYALGGDARRINTTVVCLLGTIPIVLTAFASAYTVAHTSHCGISSYPDTVYASQDSTYWTVGENIDLFPWVAPCLAMVADLLVAIFTWTKTFRDSKDALRAGIRSPLVWVLFRDGSIYFIILTLLNVAQIIETIFQPGNSTVFFELYPSGGFTGLLQPILISRFILNLKRSANGGTDAPSTIDYNRATNVIFANPTSNDASGAGSFLFEGMDRGLSHGFIEDAALADEAETPC